MHEFADAHWRKPGSSLKTALTQNRAELDQLTQKVIAAGIASWSGGENDDRQLIVRGHANLLEDLHALEDLERVRLLFDDLKQARCDRSVGPRGARRWRADFIDRKTSCVRCPVRPPLLRLQRRRRAYVGVLGVIGPTRLNYRG